jgi:5-methylcytosine-specific restriction protein B
MEQTAKDGVRKYLIEFSREADAWFARETWLPERFAFYKNFFRSENLERLNWAQVQELGNQMHCFQSLAIARGNALGKPNHPIERYRSSFLYLVLGKEPLEERLNALSDKDSAYYLYGFGPAAWTELTGYALPEEYVMMNSRDMRVCNFLRIELPFRGVDPLGTRFVRFNEAIAPVLAMYTEIVGRRTPTTLCLEVDQFFSWLYNRISKDYTQSDSESEESVVKNSGRRYGAHRFWLLAPGPGGKWWDDFYNRGIAAVGWPEVGDLRQYTTREELRLALKSAYPDRGTSQNNNALCLWQFLTEMKPGDIIIPKEGKKFYLGYGVVTGEYEQVEMPDGELWNARKVEWKKRGKWEEDLGDIVMKTLTDITKYGSYVERLERLLGIGEHKAAEVAADRQYYWLNANPKYWRMHDFDVGQEQSYTSYNEKGNKRSRYEYFENLQPGDLLIGYETTPTRKVIAVLEATRGLFVDEDDGLEKVSFRIQKFFSRPVPWEELKTLDALKKSEPLTNNQGSLFRLTRDEFHALLELGDREDSPSSEYTLDQATSEVFLGAEKLEEIREILAYRQNIILQGPPGVGKTYMAKRLAYLLMEEKDDSRIAMVQFHQSYSYEDFVQGYRPTEDGRFRLENGLFYRFCKKAMSDPSNMYFFIIDEINRGNLSKIFGELMLLIEADKRGEEYSVPLTYSGSLDNKFFIPDNVYLIGTMNTADRSLAVVDYALRRRFAFISIHPSFGQSFRNHLLANGVEDAVISTIVDRIAGLNQEIREDRGLGDGFLIGHSYFCQRPEGQGNRQWYDRIVRNELGPLLDEYWYDDTERAALCKRRLLE